MFATIAAVLWIVFDVGATLVTAPPLLCGNGDRLFTAAMAWCCSLYIVGFLEWKAQRRERARDKADKAELIRLLQESQEQNRAEFQTLKADIKAINQKPEAAQQKARLVSSSIPRSARQSVRLRQRVRDRASGIRVECGRSVCLARGNLGR